MSELRIVRGNSFKTRIKVHALNPDMTEMSDFSLLDCTNIELFVLRAYKAVRIRSWEIHSDDEIDITWDAPFCMNLGIYGLEIRGRLDGVAWRFANRDLFTIVETTQEGNIPEGSFIADGDYEMEADFVLVLRVGAVQSDWSVENQSDPAYILHKPQFRGQFPSVQAIRAGVTDPHLDDTALVKTSTGLSGNIGAYFHRYNGEDWVQMYMVESTMLSTEEWMVLESGITADMIPSTASASNQLADKAWVSANAAEVFVYEVDASNLVGGRKEVEDTTVYPLLSSHEAAGDVVLVRLTNNASYPFVLPVIQRTSSTMLFAATLNGARLFTGYVEVYAEGYTIYCAADEYYTKPSGGIPASDMDQAVQTSLGQVVEINDIKAKIPAAASSSNQLADKAWVSANAGGSVIVDVDASNIEDNMKIIAGSEIYDAVIAGLNAGKTVYLRLTNNSDFPYILPMISRGQTDIIFSQFCYEATTRAAVVYVYSDSAVIFAYLLNLYDKPTTGIPKADLSANVQTSLGKADTAYQKPSGGIPKTDLASAVQTSLGKADTALQAETLFINSAAYTINSADLANWNGKADKVTVVNHGTSSTTLAIAPNTFHVWGTVGSLNITLTAPTGSDVYNEYMFQFTSGSTATNLTLPSSVQWMYETPTIEANKTYQCSIVNNVAVIGGTE